MPTAKERAGVAAGGWWICKVAAALCPAGRQLVDWFPAVQQLVAATSVNFPDDRDRQQRQQGLPTPQDNRYRGCIHPLIASLQHHDSDVTYFERQQRLAGAGLRWHADKHNYTLVMRTAHFGNAFDTLCAAA